MVSWALVGWLVGDVQIIRAMMCHYKDFLGNQPGFQVECHVRILMTAQMKLRAKTRILSKVKGHKRCFFVRGEFSVNVYLDLHSSKLT